MRLFYSNLAKYIVKPISKKTAKQICAELNEYYHQNKVFLCKNIPCFFCNRKAYESIDLNRGCSLINEFYDKLESIKVS